MSIPSEVGIDIIETARIRHVLEKHPRRFLDRVYTEWEQMYCRGNVLHLSGRWAAKEAVSKVLGLGVRGVGWREIEIRRTRAGQPIVALHGRAAARRDALGLREPLSVSISHIRDLAVANDDDEEITGKAEEIIRIPRTEELLEPVLAVVPLQLLAYHIADRRGNDVDQPRNLAKAVTVE